MTNLISMTLVLTLPRKIIIGAAADVEGDQEAGAIIAPVGGDDTRIVKLASSSAIRK